MPLVPLADVTRAVLLVVVLLRGVLLVILATVSVELVPSAVLLLVPVVLISVVQLVPLADVNRGLPLSGGVHDLVQPVPLALVNVPLLL